MALNCISIHRRADGHRGGLHRALVLVLGLCWLSLLSPAEAHGQDTADPTEELDTRAPFFASTYLPLGHWAYDVLGSWVASGRITTLSPFTTPYRRMDVALALEGLEPVELSGAEAQWLERLRSELSAEMRALATGEAPEPTASVQIRAGGTFFTQTHRDVLRPELDGEFGEASVLDEILGDADGQFGPVVFGVSPHRRGLYTEDPQFPGGRVVPRRAAPVLNELKLRAEEAYLELQSRYARVAFGRQYKNWGLPGQHGFLRSDYAYSQDEISYRFGSDRVFLAGSVASYSDFGADTTHYVSTHRLEIRPSPDFLFALSEAAVHGGPSQGLNFSLINPVGIWQIAVEDGPGGLAFNKVGQIDLWWRAKPGVAVYGSLLADATNESGSCCQLGGSLGLQLGRLAPGLSLRLSGSAIQSLAYRTLLPWEEYSVNRIGLGWDKTDLYLFSAQADWLAGPELILRPRIEVQIRGEGDFRLLRPEGDLSDFDPILLGEPENTVRVALGGRWRSAARFGLDLEWDIGVNSISDFRNAVGDDRTEIVGSVKAVLFTPRWSFSLD
ncbi:MAG: hypothetical protein ABFS14_13130 [Gemmatimonadota bacterium]